MSRTLIRFRMPWHCGSRSEVKRVGRTHVLRDDFNDNVVALERALDGAVASEPGETAPGSFVSKKKVS